MKVLKLTVKQKNLCLHSNGKGKLYAKDARFNPKLDAGDTPLDENGYHVLDQNGQPIGKNRNWIIGLRERELCDETLIPEVHAFIHDENKVLLIDHNPILRKI